MADGDAPDQDQKTEDATPKKLEESREKGQVPHSRELDTWLILLAATILIGTAAPGLMASLAVHLKTYIAMAPQFHQIGGGFYTVFTTAFVELVKIIALPFLILFVVAIMGPLSQVGVMFAPEVIKPDISKLSPIKGFQRLFSLKSIIEFVKGLAKISIISIIIYIILKPYFPGIEHSIGLPPSVFLDELHTLVIKVLVASISVLVVVAIGDVFYQRFDFAKRQRMTKQEVKDEFKQTEGDPYIRSRLKQLRMEKARQRMMANVPKADVIITNPTHYAIALSYNPEEMDAPVLLAKGVDEVAMRIREAATEHKIMIVENPPLARSLYAEVEIDQQIPPEFFKAVAEVISYVFQKQGKLKS